MATLRIVEDLLTVSHSSPAINLVPSAPRDFFLSLFSWPTRPLVVPFHHPSSIISLVYRVRNQSNLHNFIALVSPETKEKKAKRRPFHPKTLVPPTTSSLRSHHLIFIPQSTNLQPVSAPEPAILYLQSYFRSQSALNPCSLSSTGFVSIR